MKRVGLIVNPIAGMGGSVGLKGTDGPVLLKQARLLGAHPLANTRALAALRCIADLKEPLEIFCYPDDSGENAILAAGLKPKVVATDYRPETNSHDTKIAVQDFLDLGIDLLIFVGGDGTARDIEAIVKRKIPVIGVPAGVKMHSAVFAVSPLAAGQLAAQFLSHESVGYSPKEVMDRDENSDKTDLLSSRLFGFLNVPNMPHLIQGPKISSRSEPEEVMGIAQAIIEGMDDDTNYVIGPGTTCKAILKSLHLDSILTGVDIVRKKDLICGDANESDITACVTATRSKIVVTVIGGQGFIFGRGNQQISEKILFNVGIENIIVIATQEKLLSLEGNPLRIDLNIAAATSMFPDYIKVVTGYNTMTVYPVEH
jgi:predicted polyphosphate/ATP-dependent NAD kinase